MWDVNREEPVVYIDKDAKEDTLGMWQKEYAKDSGSVVSDPMFADVENYDFSFCENSPALGMEF